MVANVNERSAWPCEAAERNAVLVTKAAQWIVSVAAFLVVGTLIVGSAVAGHVASAAFVFPVAGHAVALAAALVGVAVIGLAFGSARAFGRPRPPLRLRVPLSPASRTALIALPPAAFVGDDRDWPVDRVARSLTHSLVAAATAPPRLGFSLAVQRGRIPHSNCLEVDQAVL